MDTRCMATGRGLIVWAGTESKFRGRYIMFGHCQVVANRATGEVIESESHPLARWP